MEFPIKLVSRFGRYSRLVFAIFILMFFSFLIPGLRSIMGIIILIMIGAGSLLYQYYFKYFGFELCFFSTVIASLVYGPVIGMIVGALTYIIGQFMVGQLSQYSIVTVLGLVLSALLAPLFVGMNLSIFVAGILIVFLMNILMGLGWALMGFNPFETIIVTVINLCLNYVVFSVFGKIIYGILMVWRG